MKSAMSHDSRRTCIYNYVTSAKSHPTAEDVFHQVRNSFPKISLGTVYRNLNDLVTDGLIRKLAMDGNPDRYDSITPHDHMICLDCGSIVDIESIRCSVGNLPENTCVQYFSATAYGRCASCSARGEGQETG